MMKSMIYNTIFNYSLILNTMIMLIMLYPMKKIKFHPIILMTMLMLLTIMISIKMNLIFKSWIPFILFLTMIGGLMIIYMYITSLANNEFFYMKFTNMIIMMFKMLIIVMSLIYIFKKLNFTTWNTQDCWNLNKFMEKKNELDFSEIYNLNYLSMLTLMFYLYFSMICIMNICYKFNSPLRQLYFYE